MKFGFILILFLLLLTGCAQEPSEKVIQGGENNDEAVVTNDDLDEEAERLILKTQELNLASQIMSEATEYYTTMADLAIMGSSLKSDSVQSIVNIHQGRLERSIAEYKSFDRHPDDKANSRLFLAAVDELELFIGHVSEATDSGNLQTLFTAFDYFEAYTEKLNAWNEVRNRPSDHEEEPEQKEEEVIGGEVVDVDDDFQPLYTFDMKCLTGSYKLSILSDGLETYETEHP